VGAFGEFGRGNYDAYSYIPRYGEIFGDGDVDTYGGGLYFKAKFKQNTFVELSVRGGGASNEFKVNKDPWLLHPENHSYETDNAYYGAHFGLGHTFTLGEKTSLDGYGRYFWTRSDGDKFETRLGDKITLDAVDSQRARVGARLNHSFLEDKVNFYVGAAAEREFDGEINGHLNRDRPTDVPELKGTSGFGEIGISLKPTDSQNFVINAEAFGWAGNQEGVGGTLALSFNF
jgi:outer membrane autotransporter protein